MSSSSDRLIIGRPATTWRKTATTSTTRSAAQEVEEVVFVADHPSFRARESGAPGMHQSVGTVDKIMAISSWDIQMKRIVKLSIPYCTQALITGLMDTLTVAVIGKFIGTRDVSAYVIVNLMVALTSEFIGGTNEASIINPVYMVVLGECSERSTIRTLASTYNYNQSSE